MTFHAKFQWVHSVLGLIKYGFIKFMIKLDLVLFDYCYCDKTCDKNQYLIREKGGITDSINHNFARTRIDSYEPSLLVDKIMTFNNVIILIKSHINKNKNEYYYNIFLEKGLYKDRSNAEYF